MVDSDAVARARKVRLLITDVDGVLTDGRIFLGPDGPVGAFFCVHDGTAIKYLRRVGIETAFLSGRESEAVAARARMLGIELIAQGAKIKIDAYRALRDRAGVSDEQIAYVGDDLPDLPVLRQVGLAVAVANAVPEVLQVVHMVTERCGGDGALREVAEFILKAQDLWRNIMSRYAAGSPESGQES
jgi:3-deoxy-D-manno-octulosonate 8-phosphate phosphatase (KDO 8-P phosphatase)